MRRLHLVAGLAVCALLIAAAAWAAPVPKITICHKYGTPAQATITIGYPAAMAHLNNHGDFYGGCPVNDQFIDVDGTASPGDGVPGGIQVKLGDPLTGLPAGFNGSGLDMFDNDGDLAWTFGFTGDDLHLEGPAFCPTGIRDGLHDLSFDCVVLDWDGSLFGGQNVNCDLEVGAFCTPPLPAGITFYDANANGAYDDGEDLILDDGDGIFN